LAVIGCENCAFVGKFKPVIVFWLDKRSAY
jgi:hypothetical protein